jgi:hypothetical protein
LNVTVYGGIVDHGSAHPSLLADDRELEQWLLGSGSDSVTGAVSDHVGEALTNSVDHRARTGAFMPVASCAACAAVDAPRFRPAAWNSPTVQQHNNSYNYANNRISNTFAQPGRAKGKAEAVDTCVDVLPLAQLDGLVASPNFITPLAAGGGWYVALVVWPRNDYHWYRQDTFGCWSHKPGSTSVRNTDSSGRPIADPKSCDRGPYTEFVGYMVTNASVTVR